MGYPPADVQPPCRFHDPRARPCPELAQRLRVAPEEGARAAPQLPRSHLGEFAVARRQLLEPRPHQRRCPAKQHHGRKSGHRATEDPTDAAATDAASEAWTAQSRAACGHESSHEAGRKGCKGSRGKEGSKPEATKSRGGEASRGGGLGP